MLFQMGLLVHFAAFDIFGIKLEFVSDGTGSVLGHRSGIGSGIRLSPGQLPQKNEA